MALYTSGVAFKYLCLNVKKTNKQKKPECLQWCSHLFHNLTCVRLGKTVILIKASSLFCRYDASLAQLCYSRYRNAPVQLQTLGSDL